MKETRVTPKYQTTIPKEVRKYLGVKPGGAVRWHLVKGMVVVDVHKKISKPVMFLTSQTKLDVDAVKLVRQTRKEYSIFDFTKH